MTVDFDQGACRAVRSRLDVYLDGELSPDVRETVEQHVNYCTACRAEAKSRRELADRLQAAGRREKAPDALRGRIRSAVAAEPAPGRSSPLWSIAAAAAVVVTVGWGASLHFTGAPPHIFMAAELEARMLAHEIGDVLGLGIGDHIHCAAYRRFADANLSFEHAAADMAAADAASAFAVADAVSDEDLALRLAHRCDFAGREFLHFALTDRSGGLVSVLFTERASDEKIEGVTAEAEAGGYDVSGFADGGRWAFVASDRGLDSNRKLTARLRKRLLAADFVPSAAGETPPTIPLKESSLDAALLFRDPERDQPFHARPAPA